MLAYANITLVAALALFPHFTAFAIKTILKKRYPIVVFDMALAPLKGRKDCSPLQISVREAKLSALQLEPVSPGINPNLGESNKII